MFEPSFLGKESYHVFNSFPPYDQSEIDIMFYRLNKVYHEEKLEEEDYKILTRARKSTNRLDK
jgi:hypothetical protein